jgi:hypothetical protein
MEGAQVGALALPVANRAGVKPGPLTERVPKSIAESKSSQTEIVDVGNNHSTTLTVIMLVVPA